jgi:hypothetical protein
MPGLTTIVAATCMAATVLGSSLYNLWDLNPVSIRASYLTSNGLRDAPPRPKLRSY